MIQAHILTDHSLTVIINGKVLTMQHDNPSFNEAKKTLAEGNSEALEALFDVAIVVERYASGSIRVTDGQVFYKDNPVHGHVVDRILAFMREGLPYKPLVAFLDKLMLNPSRRAVNELYTFLEHKNMPLTPDGNFLAYKSVREDWKDHHTGKFSNTVGSVLEMARNQVCDDANIGCSNGFHAGSLSYAKSFGSGNSRLLIVEINPADVVSVPLDCECQKLRTTKYKVVGVYERPLTEQLNDEYYDDTDSDDDIGAHDDDDDTAAEAAATEAAAYKATLSQKAKAQTRDRFGRFIK
jgi:hypothetical protein